MMRQDRLRLSSRVAIFALVIGSVAGTTAIVFGGEESSFSHNPDSPAAQAAPGQHAQHAQPKSDASGCIASEAAIEDLKLQREKLEGREKELAAREAELKALEQAIKDELRKVEQARADIARADQLQKKENEEKVAKIVETVEAMSPKSASQLLGQLDDALAVTAMQRMSTAKLAKILNVMEPGRSSRLTELLAGVVRARGATPGGVPAARLPASSGAAATQNTSASAGVTSGKGGERNDGKTEQRNHASGGVQVSRSDTAAKGEAVR